MADKPKLKLKVKETGKASLLGKSFEIDALPETVVVDGLEIVPIAFIFNAQRTELTISNSDLFITCEIQ